MGNVSAEARWPSANLYREKHSDATTKTFLPLSSLVKEDLASSLKKLATPVLSYAGPAIHLIRYTPINQMLLGSHTRLHIRSHTLSYMEVPFLTAQIISLKAKPCCISPSKSHLRPSRDRWESTYTRTEGSLTFLPCSQTGHSTICPAQAWLQPWCAKPACNEQQRRSCMRQSKAAEPFPSSKRRSMAETRPDWNLLSIYRIYLLFCLNITWCLQSFQPSNSWTILALLDTFCNG